jgi:MSHA biogenesis protein MshQ
MNCILNRGLYTVLKIAFEVVFFILFFSGQAHAALAINSVTVDGAATTNVAPGATITVVVDNSGTTSWGSTGWYIGTAAPGTWNCNAGPSPSVSGNNNIYTFTITAPTTPGTYNAYFRTSSNSSNCGSTTSSTYILTGGVIVVGPPAATTVAASSLSATGATLNGTVTSNGASTTVTFDYGLTTGYGSSITASQSPLAAGASGAAVSATLTGLTCNTTYHFRVNAVNSSGTTNGGDITFTTSACPFSCAPPSNIPAGVSVTCQCDTFNRASLNPSTIFNGNWLVNSSGTTTVYPYINQTTGLLRLTESSGNNATSATVPGIFPAAGNYISVEFQQYAYNGSGADGIAVTLSDYSVPPVPGAFGGSLGYAQKTGINGFAGGWVGIALDEYGNFENGGEGRYGGISASTLYPQSVGVRGSGAGAGNGTPNYPWLSGATALNPGIDNRTSTTPSHG